MSGASGSFLFSVLKSVSVDNLASSSSEYSAMGSLPVVEGWTAMF